MIVAVAIAGVFESYIWKPRASREFFYDPVQRQEWSLSNGVLFDVAVLHGGLASEVYRSQSVRRMPEVMHNHLVAMPELRSGESVSFCLTYGWPWRTLFAMGKFDYVNGSRVTSMVDGALLRESQSIWPLVIPRRVHVVELVATLLLYSLCIMATRWLVMFLQAAVRRKRVRCIACGYSLVGLTGSLCPECGVGQQAAAVGWWLGR